MSRPGSDAVVSVLYEVDGELRMRVLLRASPRVPVYLRHGRRDPRVYLTQ